MMIQFIQKQYKCYEDQNRINAQTSEELADIQTTLSQLIASLPQKNVNSQLNHKKSNKGKWKFWNEKWWLQDSYHT